MNRFARLKHYKKDSFGPKEFDPKENHASECLAACIAWSPKIREKVISLLREAGAEIPNDDFESVETQAIWGNCRPDIVINFVNTVVVFEVKVGSKERIDQLKYYRSAWATYGGGSKPIFIFSLVKAGSHSAQELESANVFRITWAQVARQLHAISNKQDCDETTINLCNDFNSYLEAEQIYSKMKPIMLNSYKAGLDAQLTLSVIFDQVETRIKESDSWGKEYEVRSIFRSNEWPLLVIDHPKWSECVGHGVTKTLQGRCFDVLLLWFCIPGIWGNTDHNFYPEIALWRGWWGNVEWDPELRKKMERIDTLKYWKKDEGPKKHQYVTACRNDYRISQAELESIELDALADRLFDFLKVYKRDLDLLSGLSSK